jgi:hypothetical protein
LPDALQELAGGGGGVVAEGGLRDRHLRRLHAWAIGDIPLATGATRAAAPLSAAATVERRAAELAQVATALGMPAAEATAWAERLRAVADAGDEARITEEAVAFGTAVSAAARAHQAPSGATAADTEDGDATWVGGAPSAPRANRSAQGPAAAPPGPAARRDPLFHQYIGRAAESLARRVAAGEDPLPYRTEDVTGGLADPQRGGMTFQISFDFDLDEEAATGPQPQAAAALLAGLRAAGLTRQILPEYGVPSGWQAGNVGEYFRMTSAVLRDTGPDWAALRTVGALMGRAAGVVPAVDGNTRIRVGLPGAGLDAAGQQALADLFRGHQDVLFRLAAGRRGPVPIGARPLPVDTRGTDGAARGLLPLDRRMAVHLAEPGSRHVDFELFASTFDPVDLQNWTVLALSLVSAAVRLAQDPSWRAPRGRTADAQAAAAQRVLATGPGGRTVFAAGTEHETAGLRSLLDTLRLRASEREPLIGLFASTPWFGGSAGRPAGPGGGLLLRGLPGLGDLAHLVRLYAAPLPDALVFHDRGAFDLAA